MDIVHTWRERPAVRWSLIGVATLAALHLVAWLLLLALQRGHGDAVLTGVEVDGVDVGGATHPELVEAVDARADERLAETVRLTATVQSPTAIEDGETEDGETEDGETEDGETEVAELTTDRRAVGMTLDTDAAVSDAWSRGRRGLWRALGDQVAARSGRSMEVPLTGTLDDRYLDDWTEEAADELSVAPQDGAIELVAAGDVAEVEVIEAEPGSQVDPDELRDLARRELVAHLGPVHLELDAPRREPDITAADVESALPHAERAVSAPVHLVHPVEDGDDLELAPSALADLLEVRADRDAAEGERLQVTTDAERVRGHLGDDRLDELGPAPQDATISLQDGEVVVSDAVAGFDLDVDATAELIVELADEDDVGAAEAGEDGAGDPGDGAAGARRGELPGEAREPNVTTDDAEAVADDAAVLASAPVVLANPSEGADLELGPDDLAEVLSISVGFDDDDAPTLEVSSSAEALSELLGSDGIDALETPPTELEVALVDGALSVDGGLPGYSWDPDAAADAVASLASSADDRTGELPGDTTQPEMTAEELAEAGVTEIVSSFSTDLVPGEPRNTNIHLAADYLDGTYVEPGETVSLNESIGPRTSDRGFVENGFIEDGELISVTGGGVSQMGTTFVNAAWFAGVSLLDFTPHSLYFQRYPMGREATLAWGVLDVVIENDSPYTIMVLTSHSSSSVTVAFASSEWADVDTWTGEPYDVMPGDERDGFTVDFGRDITYPDGSTTSESYTHTYEPDDG